MNPIGISGTFGLQAEEDVRVDTKRTLADLAKVQKNVHFGMVRGLTQLAKTASNRVDHEMPEKFANPTPFTRKAAAYTSALRDEPTATVLIKNAQAKYLLIEESGGTRRPQPGSPINLPVNQRTNQYGNIPRGAIGRLKQRKNVFVADGRTGRTKHLPPGIYQRFKTPKRGKAQAPKLLIAFERLAHYRPRLGFHDTVATVVKQDGIATIRKSIEQALSSMR